MRIQNLAAHLNHCRMLNQVILESYPTHPSATPVEGWGGAGQKNRSQTTYTTIHT